MVGVFVEGDGYVAVFYTPPLCDYSWILDVLNSLSISEICGHGCPQKEQLSHGWRICCRFRPRSGNVPQGI